LKDAIMSVLGQNSEVAQIIPGWSDNNRIVERREEIESITAFLKVQRIKAFGTCAGESLAVCHGSCRGTLPVNTVGACTECGDLLPRNFRHARQNNRGIAASHSLPSHRTAHL